MSIDILITGRLRGNASSRTSATGGAYVTFRLAANDKNRESLLCSCIAFAPAAMAHVLALAEGDAVAVSGEAAISSWLDKAGNPRQGLDVTVYEVMSPYHAGRKRQPVDSVGS